MERLRASFALIFAIVLILSVGCSEPPVQELTADDIIIREDVIEDPFDGAPLKTFAIRAYRHAFEPNLIEVDEGDHVRITVSSLDVGHGFALPGFGINEGVPPEGSTTIDFIADHAGEFSFFSSVYSGKGYKNMTGTFIVHPLAPMEDTLTTPGSRK